MAVLAEGGSAESNLPEWARRVSAELQSADARARAVAGGLGATALNWHPRPGAWGIGQCLEHLYLTNKVYAGAISEAFAGRPPGRVEELQIGFASQWFIGKYIAPNPDGRSKAPAKIVPSSEVDANVLDLFLATNQTVRDLVVAAAGYDVNLIRFKNPFLPLLRFTVGAGFEIVAKHESRHLLQAEQVCAEREFLR